MEKRRYDGPFEDPPFEYYIQSLFGLVSKDNDRDTRQIFCLSYNFQIIENGTFC